MKKNQRFVQSDRVEKINDVMSDRHYSCPCCGLMMSVEASGHAICPECAWMEDPEQSADHDLSEGKNAMSLNEAKAAFRKSQVRRTMT
ncbi:CPCC family cysteine-rich protein [Citrobacter amalonaticus]